jgi:hypothetical protein
MRQKISGGINNKVGVEFKECGNGKSSGRESERVVAALPGTFISSGHGKTGSNGGMRTC